MHENQQREEVIGYEWVVAVHAHEQALDGGREAIGLLARACGIVSMVSRHRGKLGHHVGEGGGLGHVKEV
jgi:hypothetical protein